jgi:hypothetical protein
LRKCTDYAWFFGYHVSRSCGLFVFLYDYPFCRL